VKIAKKREKSLGKKKRERKRKKRGRLNEKEEVVWRKIKMKIKREKKIFLFIKNLKSQKDNLDFLNQSMALALLL
jgi:hypothetical protein